jgi:hypothetical protein
VIESTTISQIYPEVTNTNAFLNVDEIEEIQWTQPSSKQFSQWTEPSSTQFSQSSAKQSASYPSAQAVSKSAVKPGSKESDNAQLSENLSTSERSVFFYT